MSSKTPPSFLTTSQSSRSEATALERSRRAAEIEQIRALKAQSGSSDFEAMRRQLAEKAQNGAPIHNLDEWRAEQKGKAEEERRKKMEAQGNLHGYRGKELDSRIPKKERRFRSKEFQGVVGEVDYPEFANDDGGEECEEGEEEEENQGPGRLEIREKEEDDENEEALESVRGKMNGMNVNNDDDDQQSSEESTENEPVESNDVPNGNDDNEGENEEASVEEQQEEIQSESLPLSQQEEPEPEPQLVAKDDDEEEVEEEQELLSPTIEEEPIPEPEPEPEPQQPLPEPKTYSRTDVKFSFGLIVRSSKDNNFANENLRDNETLKKCMAATAKILMDKMAPPPPSLEHNGHSYGEGSGDDGDNGDDLPEAYYDPTVPPKVISIEEQTNGEKVLEKNTKRTLVKASFPVFLRDGNEDEAGREKSLRVLKETKSTVFKALRAAVSGGSFLR